MFIRCKECENFYVGEISVNKNGKTQVVNVNRSFLNFPINSQHILYFYKTYRDFPNTNGFKTYQICFITDKNDKIEWDFLKEADRDFYYEYVAENKFMNK